MIRNERMYYMELGLLVFFAVIGSGQGCFVSRVDSNSVGWVSFQSWPQLYDICQASIVSLQPILGIEIKSNSDVCYHAVLYVNLTNGQGEVACNLKDGRFFPVNKLTLWGVPVAESSNNFYGANITYRFIVESVKCSASQVQSTDGGVLTNTGSNMIASTLCQWDIFNTLNEGIEITLTIDGGIVSLYNQNQNTKIWSFPPNDDFFLPGTVNMLYFRVNYLRIILQSKGREPSMVLIYRFKKDNRCNAEITANANGGRIQYPSQSLLYYQNEVCHWQIPASQANLGMLVTINWIDADGISPDCNDNLTIQAAYKNSKAICGRQIGIKKFFTPGDVHLFFQSDQYITGRGFDVSYQYMTAFQSSCDINQFGSTSANWIKYPSKFPYYDSNLACGWTVASNQLGMGVEMFTESIDIGGELQLTTDYVKIYNSDKQLLRVLNSRFPMNSPEFFPYNRIFVQFSSGMDSTGLGFKLGYSFKSNQIIQPNIGCGVIPTGTIRSWPWLASIWQNNMYIQGATLIHSRWVLTPYVYPFIASASSLTVRFYLNDNSGSIRDVQVVDIVTLRNVSQGDQSRMTPSWALIKLADAVPFTTICLPDGKEATPISGHVIPTAAWDARIINSRVNISPFLISAVYVQDPNCNAATKHFAEMTQIPSLFCTLYDTTQQPISGCKIFNGNPVLARRSDGRLYLHGQHFYGSVGCPGSNTNAIGIKVLPIMNWIIQTLRNNRN